uniref:CSON003946 protein n=1 Tax=Culicoides sonorensis TaxID=179676 RepID=A0A336MN02_CULSO
MGPRCEYKDLDGSYIPTRPKVLLEIASIASGVTVAVMSIIIFLIYMYVRHHKKPKRKIETNQSDDVVDASFISTNVRPFGPHHFGNDKITNLLYR